MLEVFGFLVIKHFSAEFSASSLFGVYSLFSLPLLLGAFFCIGKYIKFMMSGHFYFCFT